MKGDLARKLISISNGLLEPRHDFPMFVVWFATSSLGDLKVPAHARMKLLGSDVFSLLAQAIAMATCSCANVNFNEVLAKEKAVVFQNLEHAKMNLADGEGLEWRDLVLIPAANGRPIG